MTLPQKPRLFSLDLVRAAALVCVLIVHFNAAVTGYFTLPSRLFGSWLPGGVYLGDLGSSLFFIVSGAALMYTTPEKLCVLSFYKKRAEAVYPMFWLAWLCCFVMRRLQQPGAFSGAKAVTLLLTVAGLDQYALAAGWVSADFACVGEWFLGSILFLYLMFPLLKAGLRRCPALTWAVVLTASLSMHLTGWDAGLLAVHIPEFLFGMSFILKCPAPRLPQALWLLAWPALCALKLTVPLDEKLFCALLAAAVFTALCAAAPYLEARPLCVLCRLTGKYAYAVFLLHHVIVLRMVQGLELAALTRMDTIRLLAAYLAATGAAAFGLYHTERRLRSLLRQALCK